MHSCLLLQSVDAVSETCIEPKTVMPWLGIGTTIVLAIIAHPTRWRVI